MSRRYEKEAASVAKKGSGVNATTSGASHANGPMRRGAQPPLREVLTGLLRKSRKPLSGAERAKRALAGGYRTNRAKFINVIWTALGEIENVEHVSGQGYRLKQALA